MNAIVDIYVKLIIAVLGFVAPTVTLLFPVFFKGITNLRKELETQEAQFEELIKFELEKLDASLANLKGFKVEAKKIKEKYKKGRIKAQTKAITALSRNLHYFQLKEQIKWIFIPLFLSLVYVMFFFIIKENLFNSCRLDNIQVVSKFIIILHSILLFLTFGVLVYKIKKHNFSSNLLDSWESNNTKKWIYLVLFLLVGSILNYLFIEYNWCELEDKYIKTHIESYVLCISLLMFFFSIRRLWRIACTVIDSKPMLEASDSNKPLVPGITERKKSSK